MLKVELNKKTNNPFYGMRNNLSLYQNASKGTISTSVLDACYAEARDDKQKREVFFSILFSVGDITARQHNVFKKKKIDGGGNAQRAAFLVIMEWLRKYHYLQFKKFMFAHLFNEFTTFDNLLINRVKTTKGKKKVESAYSALSGEPEYLNDLSDYVASIIKGSNPSYKHFLAKFLTRPRLSKRSGHKTMLPETRKLMKAKEKFLLMVSEKANLPFEKHSTYYNFTGYYNWRKEYIGDLESVLFSSKKIAEFDEVQFKEWLNKIPAGARYRVRLRLLNKDNTPKSTTKKGEEGHVKWVNLGKWFLEWEKFKDEKQTEQRVLEEKVRSGSATQDDEAKLAKVKKEAKVTVGAVDFQSLFSQILTGTVDRMKVQPFLDKIKLPYNNLVFMDDSGSMAGGGYPGMTPFQFATFIATICLVKNPDDVGRSLLGFFSREARLYTTMTAKASMTNSILRSTAKKVSEPLIDPTAHFMDNLQRIREFATAMRTGNSTDVSSIPDYLQRQIKEDSSLLEQLQQFPVWTLISDGNFNQLGSSEASLNDFFKKCEIYFGFKPFIIAIDVAYNSSALAEKFSGIENFMFIPPNPAQIEQLLTNFKDMDIMDVYTPLQALHRSNRYELVRNFTI